MATQKKSKGRDYPLSPTPEPMRTDNTSVSKAKPVIKTMTNASLEEKLKIAKQLYKDNPTEVFSDAVERAKDKVNKSKQQYK